MRLLIEPAKERGRAYVVLASSSPHGRTILSHAEIPLDADSSWTRCVAEIVAVVSAGEFSKGRVLRLVREAKCSADAARWPR